MLASQMQHEMPRSSHVGPQLGNRMGGVENFRVFVGLLINWLEKWVEVLRFTLNR